MPKDQLGAAQTWAHVNYKELGRTSGSPRLVHINLGRYWGPSGSFANWGKVGIVVLQLSGRAELLRSDAFLHPFPTTEVWGASSCDAHSISQAHACSRTPLRTRSPPGSWELSLPRLSDMPKVTRQTCGAGGGTQMQATALPLPPSSSPRGSEKQAGGGGSHTITSQDLNYYSERFIGTGTHGEPPSPVCQASCCSSARGGLHKWSRSICGDDIAPRDTICTESSGSSQQPGLTAR